MIIKEGIMVNKSYQRRIQCNGKSDATTQVHVRKHERVCEVQYENVEKTQIRFQTSNEKNKTALSWNQVPNSGKWNHWQTYSISTRIGKR